MSKYIVTLDPYAQLGYRLGHIDVAVEAKSAEHIVRSIECGCFKMEGVLKNIEKVEEDENVSTDLVVYENGECDWKN